MSEQKYSDVRIESLIATSYNLIFLDAIPAELWIRFSRVIECLIANAKVAMVQSSIPASYNTEESEGRQIKQCLIKYIKNPKSPPVNLIFNLIVSRFILIHIL
jgi:hypothetical protein